MEKYKLLEPPPSSTEIDDIIRKCEIDILQHLQIPPEILGETQPSSYSSALASHMHLNWLWRGKA